MKYTKKIKLPNDLLKGAMKNEESNRNSSWIDTGKLFTVSVTVYDRVCTLRLFVKPEELFESSLS